MIVSEKLRHFLLPNPGCLVSFSQQFIQAMFGIWQPQTRMPQLCWTLLCWSGGREWCLQYVPMASSHDAVFVSGGKVLMKGVSVHFQISLPPLLTAWRKRQWEDESCTVELCSMVDLIMRQLVWSETLKKSTKKKNNPQLWAVHVAQRKRMHKKHQDLGPGMNEIDVSRLFV